MTLYRYNVTRIRAAACCPRIHYFDAEEQRRKGLKTRPLTRIWTAGDETTAGGGKIFHTVIERFNAAGAHHSEILTAVADARSSADLRRELMRFINAHCIDHDSLREKSVALRQALVRAIGAYVAGVAEALSQAVSAGVPPDTVVLRAFGDSRKRVDATIRVAGSDGVHVTGVVDYVSQDPMSGEHRIVDYKLTPSLHPNKDLMQVSVYALLHHHQHGTKPDAIVQYLHPKVLTLESKWPQVYAQRAKVYDLLASMTSWERYKEDGGVGLKPPGQLPYCESCKWEKVCEKRLGPKEEGDRDNRWESLSGAIGAESEPPSTAFNPPRPEPEDALVEGPVEDDAETLAIPPHRGKAVPARPDAGGTMPMAGAPARPVGAAAASEDATRGPSAATPSTSASTSASLELGADAGDATRHVSMLPSVLNTHVAVVGAAGSGKTWMAKVIAEEAILAGIPVLAVDPQGDLVQFLRLRQERDIPAVDRDRYERFRQRVEPRVFTPGSSHATRLSLDPVRLPTPEDLARIADPSRRQEEHHAIVSAVANNLVSLCKAGGEVDSQRTFLYRLLLGMSGSSPVSLARIVEAIHDPEAFGVDDVDLIVKKAEREKLARKLHGFVQGPSASLFEGGASLDLDAFCTPSQAGRVPLNVVYLNALTDDDQKHFFVATLASEIYRWMVTSLDAAGGRTNLLFYLDEARDYIPAGGKKPPAKEPLIRLFTQGRKYGVGCLLCTQSPRQVDYNVFGNCSTKIIGRMEAAQDIDRIQDWFSTSGAVPSWIAGRKGAERGTFVGRWPEMSSDRAGTAFRSRALYSAHEGAWSPDRLEREVRAQSRPR